MYKHTELFKIYKFRLHLTTNGESREPWCKYNPFKYIISLHYNKGAGYIGSFTAFFAYKLNKRHSNNPNFCCNIFNGLVFSAPSKMARSLIQFGITQNANMVPYVDGN